MRKRIGEFSGWVPGWKWTGVACGAALALTMSFQPSRCMAEDKEISLYTMQLKPMFTKYMEGMLKGFEEAHPGVKVNWLDYPAQDYETKLLSLIVGGKGPDVLNLGFESTVNLARKGLLVPLDDKLPAAEKDKYLEAILKSACTVDGKLVALPWYQSTMVMMYNKDLFVKAGLDPSKPPKTAAEYFDAGRKIKQKTGQFGYLVNFSEDGQLKTILGLEGVPLVDKDMKKALFNTPKAASVLAEYKKLFDEGVIPRESATANHRRAIDLYKSGKAGILRSGPQFLFLIKKEAPQVYANTLVAPELPIAGTDSYDVATQNLGIYAKSKHPKEAQELALWVTNARNQLEFAKQVTIFPSVKEALADPFFSKPGAAAEDQARNVAAKQLKTATVLVPPLPRLPELNKAMEACAQQVILKGVPPAQALADAEKKWNEILNRK